MIGRLEGFEPDSARLQHQDWGTPWTEYISPGSSDALIWYASQFYWGLNDAEQTKLLEGLTAARFHKWFTTYSHDLNP
jgi:hypothetical protein